MRHLFIAFAVLFAAPVLAQDFELDLSEEKPPKPPPELRPTVAVLAVTAADKEESSQGRARILEAEVLKQLAQSDDFQTVVEPSLVVKTLGAEAGKAQTCADWACFEWAAKTLKVHRALRITVAKSGPGSEVTVIGYDPAFPELLTLSQESGEKAEKSFLGVAGKSQAQKDREFIKKISGFIRSSLVKLATPNGKISVDSPEASAAATIDGVEAGIGSFEAVAQRGLRTVKVAVAGFEPFEQQVKVEPQKTATVKVTLKARPMEVAPPVTVVQDTGTPIYARPGLYIAVAGAVAAGVGIAFGQMAMATQRAIDQGGDPVGVTRAQAKNASTQALLANILVATGAAMAVGGTTWVLLTPSGPSATPPPSVEPGARDTGAGAMLHFGGAF
ncbi:MAG: PEGA domain-containing protein [Myxococcota bacterium]